MISKITIRKLEGLRDSTPLAMDELSHEICIISHEDRDFVQSAPIVALASGLIASGLATQFQKVQRKEQIHVYHLLERHPQSKSVAGVMYEAMVQSRLQYRMPLDLIPMVRQDASGKDKAQQPRWYSSHMHIHGEALEESRLDKLTRQSVPVTGRN